MEEEKFIYPVGAMVKAIVDSGGDPADNIPMFKRDDTFTVIKQYDNWVEVAQGIIL